MRGKQRIQPAPANPSGSFVDGQAQLSPSPLKSVFAVPPIRDSTASDVALRNNNMHSRKRQADDTRVNTTLRCASLRNTTLPLVAGVPDVRDLPPKDLVNARSAPKANLKHPGSTEYPRTTRRNTNLVNKMGTQDVISVDVKYTASNIMQMQ